MDTVLYPFSLSLRRLPASRGVLRSAVRRRRRGLERGGLRIAGRVEPGRSLRGLDLAAPAAGASGAAAAEDGGTVGATWVGLCPWVRVGCSPSFGRRLRSPGRFSKEVSSTCLGSGLSSRSGGASSSPRLSPPLAFCPPSRLDGALQALGVRALFDQARDGGALSLWMLVVGCFSCFRRSPLHVIRLRA